MALFGSARATVVREVVKFTADDELTPTLAKIKKRLEGTFGKAGVAAIGATATAFAGAAAVVARATAVFSDFEKALAEVSTLVSDGSISMKTLANEAQRLGVEFGRAPVDQTRAFYQAISAGATNAAAATAIVTEANKLALGGVTSLDSAIDGLTSVVNAFGVSQSEVSDVSDAFFTAVKLGKTTVGELSQNIGKLAPTAQAAGVSIDEMLAGTAALTKSGINTAEATVAMNAAIQAIIKPTANASKLAKQLGIDFSASALQSKGFKGVLDEVAEATGGSITKMAQLFPEIRGLKGALALTSGEGRDFADALGEMENKAGAAAAAAAKMRNTIAFRSDALSAALDSALISIGKWAGESDVFTDTVVGWTQILRDFSKEVDKANKSTLKPADVVDVQAGIEQFDKLISEARARMDELRSMGGPGGIFLTGTLEKEREQLERTIASLMIRKKELVDLARTGVAFQEPLGPEEDPEARQRLIDEEAKAAIAAQEARDKEKQSRKEAEEAEKKAWDIQTQRMEDRKAFIRAEVEFEEAERERVNRIAQTAFDDAFRQIEKRKEEEERLGKEQEQQHEQRLRRIGSFAQSIGLTIGSVFGKLRDQTASTGDKIKSVFGGVFRIAQTALGIFGGPFGALFGGILGGIGGLFGLQHGGLVHAQHGILTGPGGAFTDTVPAMLTPGERVLSQPVTRAIDGGRAVLGQPQALSAMGGGGTTVIVNAPMGFLQAPPTGAQIQRHHQSNVEPTFKRAEHKRDGSGRILKRRS